MITLKARLLQSIKQMLSEQNGYPAEKYSWVEKQWDNCSESTLINMQSGWMVSHPEIFNKHGIYVM